MRHRADLLEKGVLQRLAGGRRSTRYEIAGRENTAANAQGPASHGEQIA